MPDILIPARDQSGSFGAYVARPATPGKLPALILIQEIFGVNRNMRDWADMFAAQGYYVVVPDLFWRQEPGIQITDQTKEEWDKAFSLFNGFDLDKGMEDLETTLEWVRNQPECSGKVGTAGFCLGGRLAVLMSARTDIDASVSYYGVYLANHIDELPNIKTPLLMHVAGADKFAPPEVRAKYEPIFKSLESVDYYLYEGQDHAFARAGGEHYDKPSADLANQRTADFLARHLSKPAS